MKILNKTTGSIFVATLLQLTLGAVTFAQPKKPNSVEFVILITTYNTEKYTRRNLDSVIHQRSTNPYQIIIVNDGSTDGTKKVIDDYVQEKKLSENFIKVIHNEVRAGCALANIYHAIHTYIPDHKVVLSVDGDDTLSFNGVLERLEREYQDPDVWMTYGRFIVYPTGRFWTICGGYPEEVIRERSFRSYLYNVPSHLKTFKAGLFKKIKKEDLLYEGDFYKKAGDMAFMFPLLDMCAPKDATAKNHSVYISDTVLYVYNWDNSLCDGKIDRSEQVMLAKHVRSRPAYEPLNSL